MASGSIRKVGILAAICAAACIAGTAPADGCGDVREGSFTAYIPESSLLVVSCWPINILPGTVVEDLSHGPVDINSITSGELITATGCVAADGFTLDADVVTVNRPGGGGPRAFDETFDLLAIGSSFYQITGTPNPTSIGTTGTNNPDLNLQVGKRYRVNCPDAHPFEVVALDPGQNDTVLATQGAFDPPNESFPGLDWVEGSGFVEFTLAPGFADLMEGTATETPGYRCSFHTSSMRGDVNFRPVPTELVWPSGSESFEFTSLGRSVDQAFLNWSVVASVPAQYTCLTSAAPAAALNQAAGSTRWLTIADTHDDATTTGRAYSPAITVPISENPTSFDFGVRMNVQTTVAGTKGRVIAQLFNTSSGQFASVGGLEYTDTGVNVVIMGAGDGNGTAAATITVPLYSYGDAGGFAKGTWVPVSFTIDYANAQIMGHATGTDGTTTKMATATGLAMVGTLDTRNFRFCLRNHGTGNTSVASYDNVVLSGASLPSAVRDWNIYD